MPGLVVGEVAQHVGEVLLSLEDPANVPGVDSVDDLLGVQTEYLLPVQDPVVGPELQETLLVADSRSVGDEGTVRLRVVLPVDQSSWGQR